MLVTYQDMVRARAKELKIAFALIAQKTRIHPAYMSRVIRGKADFSQSQLFAIARVLRFSAPDLTELMLRRDYQCADHPAHRDYLENKLRFLEEEKSRLGKKIEKAKEMTSLEWEYYLDTMTSKIHMLLAIPEFREQPDKIMKKLGIDRQEFLNQCKLLEKIGLIKMMGERIVNLQEAVHLDGSASISKINHTNWRLEAIKNFPVKNKKQNYHCTVNFTADKNTATEVTKRFKEFVGEIRGWVDKVETHDELYHLCFDFFTD